ncbi:MAG TPA: FAD-dependent oxidoreductase [Mesorhizobium sp.]|jgi:pyruvate/2-oxoglutarate dehydrogenase complex dihydrolipoamide dehydrogenase (E3) component|nr:FAD-dependent oxidoreductase [Mesorhizobium sp.]
MSAPDQAPLTPDICVIGAGSGGLSVAAGAAAFGASVVLVERGAMGGDCLNVGCVPSKAMLAAAHRAQDMREAKEFGLGAHEPQVDWRALNAHIHGIINAIAPNDSVERFTALGVHVIEAEARFLDARTVEAGGVRIRARRFVLATGSAPLVPDIPGLDAVPFFTNETVFDNTRPIGHLLVIGGGAVGLELAQAHRLLGADVTVVTRGRALGRQDPELSRFVLDRLRAEGVAIHENAQVLGVERRGKAGVRLTVDGEGGETRLDGTHLLVAAGRKPTSVPGLDAAGVKVGPDGIEVTLRLRTTNRRIYAVGDAVAGAPRFTHAANHHAGIVLRAILFRLPVRSDAKNIPRVLYTQPELAQVGLTEEEARKKVGPVNILRWPFSENDRAQAERRIGGEIKIVCGKGGTVLGVGIAGARAGELIGLWSMVVAQGLKLSDVAGTVMPYPTLGEIGKRAAISYFSGTARAPWLRRLLGFLRFWG